MSNLRRFWAKSLRLLGSVARDEAAEGSDVYENGLRDRVRPNVEKEAVRVA